MSTALLIFAHGARDPRWADPFEAVAARVRQSRPGMDVGLAFLEFMKPTLPEAAAGLVGRGCTRLHVLPMFLGGGGHVRKDLPQLLQAVQSTHPGLQLMLHPAVGEIDSVVSAMAAAAVACAEQAP